MSGADLRLELLDTIKEQTIAAYEQQRGRLAAPAIAGYVASGLHVASGSCPGRL